MAKIKQEKVWIVTKNGHFRGCTGNPGRAVAVIKELSSNEKGKAITGPGGIIGVIGSLCYRARPIIIDKFVGSLNEFEFAPDSEVLQAKLRDKTRNVREQKC